MNMQLENLRPTINIEINENHTDERYQFFYIYDKKSDERYQIRKMT